RSEHTWLTVAQCSHPSSPTATPTTDIHTLSLPTLFRSQRKLRRRIDFDPETNHWSPVIAENLSGRSHSLLAVRRLWDHLEEAVRSEEHTSELQSPYDLVCRLLLEKKKLAADCMRSLRCD